MAPVSNGSINRLRKGGEMWKAKGNEFVNVTFLKIFFKKHEKNEKLHMKGNTWPYAVHIYYLENV